MDTFVVIRDYKPGDENMCYEIVKEGTMSTVNTAFINGLTREITFQSMVLSSALLFIFFGLPFGFCLASIPGVVVFMYFCIYSGHKFKALQITQDMYNIPRVYMSSKYTGFWVAEAFEPAANFKSGLVKCTILSEKDFNSKNIDTALYFKKIVGTVAITRSKNSEDYAWLRRMAVSSSYQRLGIAAALLKEALDFCQDKYVGVELVTTECHDVARDFYFKKGFELRNMFHKRLVGNIITVLIYELVYKFKTNKIHVSP
ncbi:N-acetyltransferase family 8 member 3-like [Nilaparvata lugens]|uniref:N-acetyltransferase family 8 member 3-like n=1 Tax=Nilaparvata lugens TaxID=108931 RepID=UPI000B97EF4D|nr:N-acetyltransferase family 8 member 3-like [Nilaparvata lugens]